MREFDAEVAELLGRETTTLCRCWKIARADGVEMGFTDHDRALSFGGVSFEPETGFSGTEIETSLGLAVPRAGVGLVATLAVLTFLFYWISLVQGEKLADRGLLPPWLGMWAANVIVGLLGIYLVVRETRDPAWRDPVRALAGRFQRRA